MFVKVRRAETASIVWALRLSGSSSFLTETRIHSLREKRKKPISWGMNILALQKTFTLLLDKLLAYILKARGITQVLEKALSVSFWLCVCSLQAGLLSSLLPGQPWNERCHLLKFAGTGAIWCFYVWSPWWYFTSTFWRFMRTVSLPSGMQGTLFIQSLEWLKENGLVT